MLFGLFVDDLAAAVAAEAGAALLCLGDGRPVPPLMYADDLACLATTPAGLQHQLDRLEAYAAAWGLTVYVSKTKVVVFEGQRRRAAPAAVQPPSTTGLPFTYGGAAIEAVDEFRVQLHMFNAMVLPVLSYGAEIWSPQLIAAGSQCAAMQQQLAFLRQLLGVR
ncbi:hypothetical protein CHLNCDRAFT_140147 [Chlorella variabilis]|uniref:Reverse transcriptase domain-containing protein n=1 Tax=Chlorella variabilis TaxID=554065 RepID=E1ZRM2_CHLVA|nr:hypothetical protein CHLNCDRAFT_140147 [Chlorella variabilis]EFN51434.1 hypothetical protein CHLNCDRAFT_140147 [Chlorella variabilis]|eukprot:XP_005843536.1 hypothetical protein CHLNCDRAFT_140147 [Chlorella variabilis]